MAEGRVKFFHEKQGWGFIEGEKGEDIFVHFADILGDGYRTLVKGETVSYVLAQSDKGLKAINVVRSRTARDYGMDDSPKGKADDE